MVTNQLKRLLKNNRDYNDLNRAIRSAADDLRLAILNRDESLKTTQIELLADLKRVKADYILAKQKELLDENSAVARDVLVRFNKFLNAKK